MTQNLKKTEPLARRTQAHEWGTLEWRVDDTLMEGAGMSVAVMNLHKGKGSPAHRHPNSHEFIYVSEGRVEVRLDGQTALLDAGDSVLCPAGTVHGIKNRGSRDARLVLSYSSGARIYEKA